MSNLYDQYLQKHKANVGKGLDWFKENLPDLLTGGIDWEWQLKLAHDASKSDQDEYGPYDTYFYGGNRSYQVVQDFNKAWLIHIHKNPHHWQYWILFNDDPKPDHGPILIEMPYNYVIEMICDWWAFSWTSGDLTEIFNWYAQHKNYMQLNDKTRALVENILDQMRSKLE